MDKDEKGFVQPGVETRLPAATAEPVTDTLMQLLRGEAVQSPKCESIVESVKQELLSYSQIQTMLGLSHKTVKGLVKRKKIPHVRFSEKVIRFPENDVRKWYKSLVCGPRG